MFVKITNGQVEKYPFTIGDLRKANPNVSFPRNIPTETLAQFGVYPVTIAPAPEFNARTHRLVTQQPAQVGGVWTVTKKVVEKDQAQIDSENSEKANNIRQTRDLMLTACDWTQVADAPVDQEAWATYRQALRDVPAQEGFPWEVTWPVAPS